MHTPTHDFDIAALSVADRIELAQKLWNSVRDDIERMPLTREQLAEVRRRSAAIDDGTTICEPFDVVMRQLRGR